MARSWTKKIADAKARGDFKAAADIERIRDSAHLEYQNGLLDIAKNVEERKAYIMSAFSRGTK